MHKALLCLLEWIWFLIYIYALVPTAFCIQSITLIVMNKLVFHNRNDGTEFGGSIYQKVNDQLETAVNLAWTAGNSNTRFGIAAKYQIDADAAFSVRGHKLVLTG